MIHLQPTDPTAEYTFCGRFVMASVQVTVEINEVTCTDCLTAHEALIEEQTK